MRNVDLHVADDVVLGIHHLRGRFVPVNQWEIPFLDNKLSYAVEIDSGEIALDMRSLTALVARVLGGGRSNVEDLEVSIDEKGRLRQKGQLAKGVDVPFEVAGPVEATSDGRIRMHAASVRSLGVTVKPVLKLFGLEMDDLLKVAPGLGIAVDGDNLLVDPQGIIPAPAIRGKVTAVHVAGDKLVQTFGPGAVQTLAPPAVSPNHIYWRGGELQFGKLTMTETDLELIDEDPEDPFDFSVDNWNDQLVAGFSKNTPDGGLKTRMPDYTDLKQKSLQTRAAAGDRR
jgi:hypothetical protein